jgi:hypothetical protein
MPKAFPDQFRRDVVAVARRRETPPALQARLGDPEVLLEQENYILNIERCIGQIGVLLELEDPAGHRHRHFFGGKVTDQRVSHLGEVPWAR